jgi:hypothetical protein
MAYSSRLIGASAYRRIRSFNESFNESINENR